MQVPKATGQLAVEVHNSLGNELFRNAFGKSIPKHNFCDIIRKEKKEFHHDTFLAKDEGIKS